MSLLGDEGDYYVSYLSGGGVLMLFGENPVAGAVRNGCIRTFVDDFLDGGVIGSLAHSFGPETVVSPFNGPNSVSSLLFQDAGRADDPANGSFFLTESGGGAGIVFVPSTLGSAAAGNLVVVFDVDFMVPFNTGDLQLTQNISNYGGGSTALIVYEPLDAYQLTQIVPSLQSILAGQSFAVTTITSTPVDMSSFDQVWDIRYSSACPGGVDPPPPPEPTTTYPTVRERVFALPFETNLMLFLERIEFLIQAGQGLVAGQGTDPVVAVWFSRDGGVTYGNGYTLHPGKIGEYDKRTYINRLGRGRNWVCKIRVSDPVFWAFLDCYVTMEEGTS